MMKARVVFFAILMLAGPAYRPARGCQAMFDGPSDGHNFGKGDKIVVHTRIEGFAVTSGIDHVGSGGQLRGGHGKLFVNGISVFDTLTAHKASISLGPSLDPLAKSHTVVLQAFRSGEARPCHSASISFATEAALPDRMADVCIFARSCVSYRDLWSTMPPLPRMERENEQVRDPATTTRHSVAHAPWKPSRLSSRCKDARTLDTSISSFVSCKVGDNCLIPHAYSPRVSLHSNATIPAPPHVFAGPRRS